MQIVMAEKQDKDEILKLYKAQLGREFCPWTEGYPSEETIDFDLSRDALFVMKEDERIVAAISLEEDEDVERLECWDKDLAPAGEPARLAVLPEMQNRGLARQMLQHVMKILKERGFQSIHFLVNKHNKKAIASYAVFGFAIVGECHMYEQDFLCYEKALDQMHGEKTMRIVNLIENTEGNPDCVSAHGLSFYVETKKHKLLLDLGPSEDTLRNAAALGIKLSAVDTVILSHGHYDHSGGIIPFTKINNKAAIYMQAAATDAYFADDGMDAPERYRYIGIDPDIEKLPQLRFISGDTVIDEELELFTIQKRSHELPFTNKRLLVRKGNEYIRDDFRHEHYLVIRQDGKSVLMSGCAHNGILSILDAYMEKYGKAPDTVISGFHLMKKTPYREEEIREIEDIARELDKYPTKFFTCHCTGVDAFDIMKTIMGERLSYVHSGEEIISNGDGGICMSAKGQSPSLQSRSGILTYGLSFPDTYQEAPFHDQNWQLVRVRPGKKAFLWTYEMEGQLWINVKVDPEWGRFWREKYKSVIPGYHQNKDHWNTIILDGSVPDEDVKRMIAESYDLVTDTPTKRIYEAVKKIPRGKVATYAQVAEMAGNPRMCRAVGNALHRNPDPENIPCYRVVNSKGALADEFVFGGAGVQKRLLEEDGIEVTEDRVDLKKYGI